MMAKKKSRTKTVYVVRKYVLDQQGQELRQEDYPNEFGTPTAAEPLLREKEAKYQQTLEDLVEDGLSMSDIPERRRYAIVPKKVPA